ncbi:MAG: fibronectin type III domain-containing protein, partial [Spirochaetaceae bacterium]|nr:fibronectin type III domain-containing protein [Spirochaetaceae bacterium]
MNTKRRIAFFAAAGLAFAGAMVLAMSGCQTPIDNPTGGNPDANAAPDGLTVTDETVDSISLEWSVSAGAAGYKVYHAATEDGEFAEAGAIEGNAFTVSGLPPDTSFWYKVSAIKGTAETEQSEAVTGTTKSAASGGGGSGSGEDVDITAPTGLLFSGASASEITLSWDAVSGAAGYKVYRSGTANGVYTYTATSDVNSYTDSGLAPNS